MDRKPAVVCWFSCGSASAVAAKWMLEHPVYGMETVVAYCDTSKNEHEDNERFLTDCELWLGVKILRLRSEKFPAMSIDGVFEKERFLMGIHGAPCTRALKKRVRVAYQVDRDIHVFGYTSDESDRWEKFQKRNKDLDVSAPLFDAEIDKVACHRTIELAGIERPAMYRLGFDHNNCWGCVKGGKWYWNQIRIHRPDIFSRRAKQQRKFDVAFWLKPGRAMIELESYQCLLPGVPMDDDPRLFLDELDPRAGRKQDEVNIDCGVGCDVWGRVAEETLVQLSLNVD